jgi:hypothetical protein
VGKKVKKKKEYINVAWQGRRVCCWRAAIPNAKELFLKPQNTIIKYVLPNELSFEAIRICNRITQTMSILVSRKFVKELADAEMKSTWHCDLPLKEGCFSIYTFSPMFWTVW